MESLQQNLVPAWRQQIGELHVQYLVSNAVQLPRQLLASHGLSRQEETRMGFHHVPRVDPAPWHGASSEDRLL